VAVTDRIYRLWDYTVSHAQLLIRSPAGPGHPHNDDHMFAGVRLVSAPTTMTGMVVVEPVADSWHADAPEPRSASRYVLVARSPDGDPYEAGEVIAAAYKRTFNRLPPVSSSLRAELPSDALDYERQVIAALARLAPDLVVPPSDAGVDAVVPGPGGPILIEAKVVGRRSAGSAVRSTVMSVVSALDRNVDAAAGVVVLGGATPAAARELRAHLVTALAGRPRFEVVQWEPEEGREALADRFAALRLP
jgi:hypothetical protein